MFHAAVRLINESWSQLASCSSYNPSQLNGFLHSLSQESYCLGSNRAGLWLWTSLILIDLAPARHRQLLGADELDSDFTSIVDSQSGLILII